jgi:hypothetical protein
MQCMKVRYSNCQGTHLTYAALKNLALDLFLALQNLPVARYFPSPNGRGIILGDLSRFVSLVLSNDFDAKSIIPILDRIDKKASDETILNTMSDLITDSTPPPRQLPYPYQIPISFNTGSFVNTSENKKHFNDALKNELDSSFYINIPGFFDTFFGNIANLTSVTDAVFRKY